jgi:hypothetical protein
VHPSAGAGRILEIDPTTDGRWDAFVTSNRDASIFHHSCWLRTLEAEYGLRPLGLTYEGSAGELLGVLPLLFTRGLPFRRSGRVSGRRLSSLPRTPTAGPLAVDRTSAEALVRAAIERARHEPSVELQLKVERPDLDGLVEGLGRTRWRPTYVLELPERPSTLRFGNARNHGRIKWAVGKSERLNVRVRAAETERELRAWYRLYLETMRAHAIPPRPYRLFSAMWALLRPQGFMEVVLAELHDSGDRKLLAGSIFLKFRETVFYAFNGSHREDLSLRPNDIIMWNAIHDAADAGYRRFDLGEVDESNPSLAQFKTKWGAKMDWLYRYYYPDSQRADESSVGGLAARTAQVAWRHLPLSATAILGDRIYSYL